MCLEDSNCVDPVSSNCVIWQGEDIACLDITTGQTLTEIENAVATRICELADDIDLSTVTLCGDFIELMSGVDITIGNLLKTLLTYNCSLKTLIDTVKAKTEEGLTLDYKCLDVEIDPCNETEYNLQTILQILINNFCTLKTTVDGIADSILETINDTIVETVTDMMQTCQTDRIVSNNLPGDERKLTFRGFVPPYCPIPYVGSLEYFDSSGKGLDDGPMCGWYLCNGSNGTMDLRGRVPVCAIQGMGGGALDPSVDPNLPKNSGSNYVSGDSGGEVRHLLTSAESGSKSHTHTVTDPGHNHTVLGMVNSLGGDGGVGEPRNDYTGPSNPRYVTDSKTTGITISSYVGESASAYHENRMPYRATYYIMMIN